MMSKHQAWEGNKNAALLECVLTREYPIKYTASHHIYIYIYIYIYMWEYIAIYYYIKTSS